MGMPDAFIETELLGGDSTTAALTTGLTGSTGLGVAVGLFLDTKDDRSEDSKPQSDLGDGSDSDDDNF